VSSAALGKPAAPTVGAWTLGCHGDLPCALASVNRTDPATILFIGDLHADSPYADRAAIRRVLDEAVERDAAIILLGDTFDAMQSRGDKRANKAALAERYAGRDDYLNALLEDVAGLLRPYARHVWILLHGNHDTGITKYHEVDLVKLLARDLNAHGGHVTTPGYQTYLAIKANTGGCKHHHVTLGFVTHGSGGASPVTKGAIGMARRATTYPDAAFIVSGHLHTDVQVSHPQYRVSHRGRLYVSRQRHVQVGAWKVESPTAPSWAVERGMPPALPAAYWLEFRRARGEGSVPRVTHRFVEAT
jgi:hypothetical protein